jgi:beta-glucosidase
MFMRLVVGAALLRSVAGGNSAKSRAVALVAEMTLDEKVAMLHGADPGPYSGQTVANTRLGIPALALNDGPQGYRSTSRSPGYPGTSTAFPCALAAAATFDEVLAGKFGAAMGLEFRGKGSNVQLGPGVNVARVPNNGRNFEV